MWGKTEYFCGFELLVGQKTNKLKMPHSFFNNFDILKARVIQEAAVFNNLILALDAFIISL